jgi:prepilin-type N-terminal cleavage/methylation domain-containing protein
MNSTKSPSALAARNHAPQGGFTLFEVMLAIMLFSFAVIGLATALNRALDASTIRRRETEVRNGLENTLAELRLQPLQPGKLSTGKPDARGVVYSTEVKVADTLETEQKDKLTGMYIVTVTANWKTGSEDQERQVQLYVYQP